MRARVLSALVFFVLATLAAATPLDDAIALYKARKLPEARVELERIATAEPKNAAACHYLGLVLRGTHDPALEESAIDWLGKAAQLEPANIPYLYEYGEASLSFADKHHTLGAATRGRDALEQIITLDPANLDARGDLYQFYQEAPWPIGSASKASAHLEELRKRDPDRAALLVIETTTNIKDYSSAFALCEDALSQKPNDYLLLLQYGRIGVKSGQNLELALSRLRKCLALNPPPAKPGLAVVHWRIGNIFERMNDKPAARAAYEASLAIDPFFDSARQALRKLN